MNQTAVHKTPGTLYVLPTPLADGAPADVLPQLNIDITRGLRHFVVENLRTARRVLRRMDPAFPIDESTFTELSEHTPLSAIDAMLRPLREGHDVGLLSEAGCPGVADPGAGLVAAAQRAGLRVAPLPGPSSILMALMASGMGGQRFAFGGYLPVDDGARTQAIKNLEKRARGGETQIFIETPYRNNRMVQTLARTLGADMALCVASNITGSTESIVTLPAAQWRTRQYDYNKIPTIFVVGRFAATP